MRIRRGVSALLVTVVGVTGAACTPPPTGGPSGPCSGQVVEPADPSLFSLPHAISANGQWLVTSRTIGEDYQLSVRTTAPSDTGSVVLTTPKELLRGVAVNDDGTRLLLQRRSAESTGLLFELVDTDTGQVAPIPAPDLALPDGASSQTIRTWADYETGFLTSSLAISHDAERVVWVRAVFPDDGGVERSYVVTDIDTGEVLGEGDVWAVRSPSLTAAVHAVPVGAVGGNANPTVTDLTDGSSQSLLPARAALGAAGVPDQRQWAINVSDDGRYVVFARSSSGFTDRLFLWDVVDEALREVPLVAGWEVLAKAAVDDRGRIQFFRSNSSGTYTAHLWDPATDTISTLTSTIYWANFNELVFRKTPDLSNFVTSVQRTTPPLGVEMRLIGCP